MIRCVILSNNGIEELNFPQNIPRVNLKLNCQIPRSSNLSFSPIEWSDWGGSTLNTESIGQSPKTKRSKVHSLSIQGLRLPTHQGAHILVEGFNPCWLCWIDYSKDCLGRGIALFCFIFFSQLGLIIWKKGQCEYGLEKGGKKRLNWKREKLERVSGNWKVRNGGKKKKKKKKQNKIKSGPRFSRLASTSRLAAMMMAFVE